MNSVNIFQIFLQTGEPVYTSQCMQCSLCAMILPSTSYLSHLRCDYSLHVSLVVRIVPVRMNPSTILPCTYVSKYDSSLYVISCTILSCTLDSKYNSSLRVKFEYGCSSHDCSKNGCYLCVRSVKRLFYHSNVLKYECFQRFFPARLYTATFILAKCHLCAWCRLLYLTKNPNGLFVIKFRRQFLKFTSPNGTI
jgi:hypothetical protein